MRSPRFSRWLTTWPSLFDAQTGGSPTQVEDQWPTLWTTVADSTNKVYYFRSTRSPFLYWVDLTKVNLATGRQPQQVDAYLPNLAGDISILFHNQAQRRRMIE